MRHLFKIFAFLFCAALACAQSVPIKNATLQGTLNGTPSGGTLNLGSVTLSLGTPSSLTLTSATALPVSGITASTSTALGVGSLNIGHATDTTLARSSAGRLSIEGVNIVNTSSVDALTNKTYEGLTITSGFGTLTIGNAKTFTASNTLTLTGTDGSSVAFGAGGTVLYNGHTSPDFTTSITTGSASFTAFAGATTLLTIGGTGASASMFAPSTLDATSSTTGAIRTSGGISAAKALNIGTNATIGGNVTLTTTGNVNFSDVGILRKQAGVLQVGDGTGGAGLGIITCAQLWANNYSFIVPTAGIMARPGFLNVYLGDTSTITWNNDASHDGYYTYTKDTGLARDSAGVLRVTDGGAGVGALKAGTTTIGSSGTAMTAILSTSATLDFPNIAATGGTQDLAITVTGAATGNVVSLGLPAAPSAGVVFNAFVSAADTVTVRATNTTGAGIDPASASYRVQVTKF